MGTWDYGLLDNDSAGDELWDILDEAVTEASGAAEHDVPPARAGRLAAQLALIVHYDVAHEEASAIRAGVARNRAALEQAAPKARALLDLIARDALDDKPSLRPLFEAKLASAYLQKLADASLEEVEECLEEQRAGAHLDLLTVIAPYVTLPAKRVKHIARRVREIVGEIDEDDDDAAFMHAYTHACRKLVAACKDDEDDEDDD